MALGMIEVFGFTTSIVVADAMAKAADVKIVAIDKNKPAAGDAAKVPLVMAIKAEGSAAAVEAAVAVGKAEAESAGFTSRTRSSQGRAKKSSGLLISTLWERISLDKLTKQKNKKIKIYRRKKL